MVDLASPSITGLSPVRLIHLFLTHRPNLLRLFRYLSEIILNYLNQFRTRFNEEIKISVNDLLIKITAIALVRVPIINSSWEECGTRKYDSIDIAIGIAVAVKDGLLTPIIRNADKKSLFVISNEAKSLIMCARANEFNHSKFQGVVLLFLILVCMVLSNLMQ
nr:2-oxo acid dehydrogenase subunit E2 [Orientia tsutsugamushi]